MPMTEANAGPAADAGSEESAANALRPDLSDAAKRALAEAEERRVRETARRARELNGRGGLDPVRYGDWEIKGLTPDF
jgi:hypothetical protein